MYSYECVSAEVLLEPTCGMTTGGHLLWPLDPPGAVRLLLRIVHQKMTGHNEPSPRY